MGVKEIAMRDFRDLKVWEKAHRLALAAYRVTAAFPKEEQYGLTSQNRRAGSSVPANIAEGCGRGGAELNRFCRIAMGSAMELDYHLLLARDLELLNPADYERLYQDVKEVRRMLATFMYRLASST
jgi:four helix bundle protein